MTILQRTLVTFLLDRTGSMQGCKESTIEAFNGYLEGLKTGDEPAAIEFTFLQFDSMSLDKICVAEDVAGVKPLTSKTYEPRASTPLIDAAFKTIKAVEESLGKRDDKPKVVICIQTDGYENASTEHTMAELNALIKDKVALGWQFNFMGAGIDAYNQSQQMGIMAESTVAYDSHSPVRTRSVFAASAANTRSFASGLSANTDFSMAQRTSAGDVHAHKHFGAHIKATGPDLTLTSSEPKKAHHVKPARPIVDDIKL